MQSQVQALEHRVVELFVSDAGVTVVGLIFPFHCWLLISAPVRRVPSMGPQAERGERVRVNVREEIMLGRVPSLLYPFHCWARTVFSIGLYPRV